MLKRIALALMLSTGLASHVGAVEPELAKKVVADAIDQVVLPDYRAANGSAAQMSENLEAFCARPTAKGLDEARTRFDKTVTDWSRAEMIRFGPVTRDNRLERILYWPDRKSIGLKQVQEVLVTKDATATDPKSLVGKSVALQGLGALEFTLFGTGSEALAAGDAFRCDYAKAIAANIHQRIEEINEDWASDYGAVWRTPGPDNAHFRTTDESLTEVLNTLIHGLEMVRDVRIGGFLGEEPDKDRPKQAIYWRSAQTVASIRSNLAMLRDLFVKAGVERLLTDNSRWIAQSIEFEFNNADQALDIDGDIAGALSNPEKRAKLAYAVIVTSSLTDLIANRLTSELGLTAGFSSLDGD